MHNHYVGDIVNCQITSAGDFALSVFLGIVGEGIPCLAFRLAPPHTHGYERVEIRWSHTECHMGAKIINRGRGPEIEGTRITVYDVFDYVRQGWHRDRIAALFRLSSRDVQAALEAV
jgi:hypothetical protein